MPKVHYKQINYDNFEFDVARNESLAMVPEDVDICISTDIDEYLNEGWRDNLVRAWNSTPGVNRARYKNNLSFDSDGNPTSFFWQAKVHARKGFTWHRPIHEYLLKDEGEEIQIELNDVWVDHHQDPSKSREFYLSLLEKQREELPQDSRTCYLLGREYYCKGRMDEAIETLHAYLRTKEEKWNQELAVVQRYLADAYKFKGYAEEALMWYGMSCRTTPSVREPKYYMGLYYYELGDFKNAAYWFTEALKINMKNNEYISDENAWNGSIYEYLSFCEYFLGNPVKAVMYCEEAIRNNPEKTYLNDNLKMYKEALNK